MPDNMLSLYDYLGRPAGPALGLEVAKYAASQGAEKNIREISNPKYTGPINLYTESFLDSFFNNPNYKGIINTDKLWYESRYKNKNKNK